MLGYTEAATWKKTPYQLQRLFEYHKEYNPQQFRNSSIKNPESPDGMDAIDIALGGL